MKTTIALLLFALVSTAAQASGESNYYPEAFIAKIASAIKDDALKTEINTVLSSTHKTNANGRDTLGCDIGTTGCYEHIVLGYDGARKVLFGKIHLEEDNGKYFIKDVYCRKIFSGGAVKPGAIPNHAQINCEHTWPQSKFSRLYPAEMQKSDLNHLYPTDSKANSVRGNFDFADISHDNGSLDETCSASRSGSSEGGGSSDDLFEPPTEHKGNVARALFYFSVRYKIKIPTNEEPVLRRWNELDPVDDAERARNEEVFKAQKNRNPFIDFPNLANYINKF
ncbi:MAG: endonuclease [Bdellovibrionales bacterium]|nr:endonuclease [Bdellovibrionales bacterium]